jgi:hypothetical protein
VQAEQHQQENTNYSTQEQLLLLVVRLIQFPQELDTLKLSVGEQAVVVEQKWP